MEMDPKSVFPEGEEKKRKVDEEEINHSSEEEQEKKKKKKHHTKFLSPEDAKQLRERISFIVDTIKKDPLLRVSLNDKPELSDILTGREILIFLQKISKNENLTRNDFKTIDKIIRYVTPILSLEETKQVREKIAFMVDVIKKDPVLRSNLNDNPDLNKVLKEQEIVKFLEELHKNKEMKKDHAVITDKIISYMSYVQSAKLEVDKPENFGALLTNLSLTQSEAVARVQKIIYLLENNKGLHKKLNEKYSLKTNIIDDLNTIIENLDSNPQRIEYIKKVAVSLEQDVIKETGNNVDTLLQEIKKSKVHKIEPSKQGEVEIQKAKEIFPKPEVERRMLLHEDIAYRENEQETSRFQVLDNVATILRKYREEIKELIGPEARIKFRGSLVRGLKGYPKSGVAPTLDSYDCDAFIEVPDEWWRELKKLRPAAKVSEDGKVRIKPLRDYENLESIDIGIPGKRPKPILEARAKDEKNMEEILQKLLEIEQNIKKDLVEAKKSGALSGYALNEKGEIDFEFYLRPVSAVKHTYTEGNPYTKEMIEARGYPSYAAAHETTVIREFRQDVEGRFKRTILPVMLEKNKDGYKPEGIILEEYQAVIGRRNWYIEDRHLFNWRKEVHDKQQHSGKVHARRTNLEIYKEPLAPVSRDYLDGQYKNLPSQHNNTGKDQKIVNAYFEFMHGRTTMNLQGVRNSFCEAHPIFELGNAQDLIPCLYAPGEYFSIDKFKALNEDDKRILRDFFKNDNELTSSIRKFLKADEFPLYVKEFIDVMKKTAKIPEENKTNFFNEIVHTLQGFKKNAVPYKLDEILDQTAVKYVESVKGENPVSSTAPKFNFGEKH